MRCGLVRVHRWSALNDRQRVLLESLAGGEEPHAWAPGEWPSAYALRDRGLLKISRDGGALHTEVTEAGRFYLHHGHHPDDPAFADQVPSAGTPASTDRGGLRHATKHKRAARLVVELDHGRSSWPGWWRDRRGRTLEDSLGAIFGEIEARALDDTQRRENEERAGAERAAMKEAKERAVQGQPAGVLREEVRRWREAIALGEYCDALERRLAELGSVLDGPALESAVRWLEWARMYAQAMDPLNQPPGMPVPRDPTPEELKPHLKGWSFYGPER